MKAPHLVALTLLLFAAQATPAADPFQFTAPPEWRTERIPFPLGFAPELKHRGFEELRFGPGMFRPGSDTYWTYVFFWWIEGKHEPTTDSLRRDLLGYYQGLSRTVGKPRGMDIDPDKIKVAIQAAEKPAASDPAVAYAGTLTTYDAFATGKLVHLHLEVSNRYFPKSDRTWVFFALSPKPPTANPAAPVWKTMRQIRDSFRER